jgi:hypothetical protein
MKPLGNKPIPFAEWQPDTGVLGDSAGDAKGVYSYGRRYQPLLEGTSYGVNATTADRALGYFGAKQGTNQIQNFFGDRHKLYHLVNHVMTDISRVAGYNADPDSAWKFDQYNDYVIAACPGAPVQIYQMGADSIFADLGIGEADTCGRIGPHMLVIQGNILKNSAFNNPTDWVPNLATQAAEAFIDQRGGRAMAILGGTNNGYILQERMISNLDYVGGATAFHLSPVEFNRGPLGPLAMAQMGRFVAYAAEDGIFLYDGVQSEPIGANKVDRYFSSRLNYSYRNKVCCAIDTEKKCLSVAYPTGSGADISEMLVYSFPDQRWTHDDISAQLLFQMPKEGVSVDDTAAVTAVAGTTAVDSITLSVDSPLWRETRKQWAAVNASQNVVLFNGATRPAILETATIEGVPGKQAVVTKVMPVVDATPATVTVNVLSRQHRLDQTEAVGPTSDVTQYGAAHVRCQARFLGARVNIGAAASWTEAVGIHTDARAAGER